MARLSDAQKEDLFADFNTGEYSNNELAKKYNTSHTTVNKIVKGMEPKYPGKVSAILAVKRELAKASFKEVSAIETLVEQKLRRENLVYDLQEKALHKANVMLEMVDNPNDLRLLVNAVDKASITLKVSDRFANAADINVNASAAVQNNNIKLSQEEMIKEAKNRGLPLDFIGL
jgi:hypothetical protein